jgi:hypothetical protein
MSPARRLRGTLPAAAWLALLLPLLAPLRAADTLAALGPRHHEPSGGFSYCPPKGWAVHEVPGAKYKYAIILADGFTPLISVIDEDHDTENLEDFTAGNLSAIKEAFPDFQEVSSAAFTTASGLKGSRHIVTLTQKGKPLRQSLCFIDGGNGRKYLLKGSALAKDGDSRDAGFLSAALSFEVEPVVAPGAKAP